MPITVYIIEIIARYKTEDYKLKALLQLKESSPVEFIESARGVEQRDNVNNGELHAALAR